MRYLVALNRSNPQQLMKQSPYNLYIKLEALHHLLGRHSEMVIEPTSVLKTGLVALELSTRLLGSLLQQNHPRNETLLPQLLQNISTQFALLIEGSKGLEISSLPLAEPSRPYTSQHWASLEALPLQYAPFIQQISQQYSRLTETLGLSLGLEQQWNRLRKQFQLSPISFSSKPVLDYASYVSVEELSTLTRDTYFNAEDELFMTVHQITECWFSTIRITLAKLENDLQAGVPPSHTVQKDFEAVNHRLSYVGEHIFLLEHLVLADYHPLRVALRGASGGQSKEAEYLFVAAKRLFAHFEGQLEQAGMTLLVVLEFPEKYPQKHAIIQYFSQLERQLKNFFFQHYMLASNIIGAQSLGSIGYELSMLTSKFVNPIFKSIDQAKYELTLKTNFQYAAQGGQLLAKEEVFDLQYPTTAVAPDLMEAGIRQYFEAISALQLIEWLNLFVNNGAIVDPDGSRPYVGKRYLTAFFKGVQRTFKALNMQIKKQVLHQASAEVFWTAKGTAHNGKSVYFEGKETFYFNVDGSIQTATVDWDPAVVAQQL